MIFLTKKIEFFQKERRTAARIGATLVVLGASLALRMLETTSAAPMQIEKSKRTATSQRSTSSDQTENFDGTNRSAVPSRGRTVERNDGSLPASDVGSFFDVDEETNLAERWSDTKEAARLREKVLDAARTRRENWPTFREIDADAAQKLGVRKIDEKHVVFWTDLPASSEVDEIPDALSSAVEPLCNFFEIDENRFENWKVEAFLIADVDKFIRLGVLDGPPRFLHGYSDATRVFALDKKIGYYNRFLLLHEMVHTLMHELFGDLRPRWFSEGCAEYLALHRWNSKKKSIEIAQIPESEDATPGFGRLRQIQEIVRAGDAPTIREIMDFQPRDYVEVSTYAWSWAFVLFLQNSPKYREIMRRAPYWSTANEPNRVFCETIGERWDELETDWSDFVDKIDYRYDFEATEIDAAPGRPLADVAKDGVFAVDVAANRGWQNSGVALEAGETVRLTASGRFDFFVSKLKKTLDFEASGATFEYLFGVPSGRLEVAVVPRGVGTSFVEFYENAENKDVATYWRSAVGFETASTTFTPERSGTVYFRINAAPGNLARNGGGVRVQFSAKE